MTAAYCKVHVWTQNHTGDDYVTNVPPTQISRASFFLLFFFLKLWSLGKSSFCCSTANVHWNKLAVRVCGGIISSSLYSSSIEAPFTSMTCSKLWMNRWQTVEYLSMILIFMTKYATIMSGKKYILSFFYWTSKSQLICFIRTVRVRFDQIYLTVQTNKQPHGCHPISIQILFVVTGAQKVHDIIFFPN